MLLVFIKRTGETCGEMNYRVKKRNWRGLSDVANVKTQNQDNYSLLISVSCSSDCILCTVIVQLSWLSVFSGVRQVMQWPIWFSGSFFLCRVTQNIYGGKSRQFKLNWLSLSEAPNTYRLDYMDKAEMDSILTNVRMERVSRDVFDLPAEEQERINKVLNKTLKFVAGDLMEEDFEEEQKVNNLSEEEEGKFTVFDNGDLEITFEDRLQL